MLSGKTVFITGAGSGIGRKIAIIMSRQHAEVYLVGRAIENVRETATIIHKEGGDVGYCKCDVADAAEVRAAVQKAVDYFGKLDTVINNAAIFEPTNILNKELEKTWRETFEVNLMGTVHVICETAPHLIRNGKGSIINIASVDAYDGCKGYSAYSASKGGVVSLTKSLALDLGQYFIRVNAIAPGITDTPMTHERIVENEDKYLNRLALKRIGEDTDIANTAIFLTSDMSEYMTGQVLHVNGGMRLA